MSQSFKRRFSPPRDKASASSSRGLALVPVLAAIFFGALMLPRPAVPEEVPLPRIDAVALARVQAEDDDLVRDATAHPLSPTLLLLGTAIRNFVRLEVVEGVDRGQIDLARQSLETAVREATRESGAEGLLRLRAVQTARFVDAVHAFEATGNASEELTDLGGNFVAQMRRVGWMEGNHLLLSDAALRALQKTRWNQIVSVDRSRELALDLEEQRALFSFYLSHPVTDAHMGQPFEERRKAVTDKDECHALAVGEATAKETWRLERIKRLGAIDKEYPLSFALGVSNYRAGNYHASVDAFRTHLADSPNGPYSSLARSYLRAAVREAEVND
jgi:hypothetical protein